MQAYLWALGVGMDLDALRFTSFGHHGVHVALMPSWMWRTGTWVH